MNLTRYAALITACGLLSACGGGGSISASAIIDELPVDETIDEIVEDITGTGSGTSTPDGGYTAPSDFASHWGHTYSGAVAAYQRGITGQGVVVAVVDDGVASTNPEFAGRMLAGFNAFSDTAGGDPVVNNDCDGFGACDTGRHGTMVAGVIGAAADGTGAHGVAPGVHIFSLNVDTRANDGLFSGEEIANPNGFAAALDAGATIFNHSYAVRYDPALRSAFEAGNGGVEERLLEAIQSGAIHVYATGNDGMDQPSMESLWPVWNPDLDGGIIAVTGIVQDGQTGDIRLASYANRCGDAQDWCLSAPTGDYGRNERFIGLVAQAADGTTQAVIDPDQNGLEHTVGGTSAAAAYVSGALALLQEAFPELGSDQLGVILLDTATDLGETGTDATYGRGVVNIARAMQPQGTPSVASGATVDDSLSPLSATTLSLNSTMASAGLLAGRKMVFFDGYGRPYDIDPATLVSETAPYRNTLTRLSATLDSLTHRGSTTAEPGSKFAFGVMTPNMGSTAQRAADAGTLLMLVMEDARSAESGQFDGGFMALADEATASIMRYAVSPKSSLSLTMGSARPTESETGEDVATLDYSYTATERLALGLRAGMLRERGGLLGSEGAGALALSDRSMTRFIEGRFARRMGEDIALIGEVGIGQTDPGDAAGYVRFTGPLTSLETRLGLALSNIGRKGDTLTISGGIPLHVVDGTAQTRLPTGRDAAGNVQYTTTETELGGAVPLELRFGYAVPLTDALSLGIDSALRREGTAEVYGDLAVGMRLQF